MVYVVFSTALIFAFVQPASADINRTLAFQGRLLDANGGIVADGSYNIEFKLYQGGNGDTAGGGSGSTLEWTESYVNNNNNEGVKVKNGYFSVYLGSKVGLNNVDWNNDRLWLSMNVAGASANCTSFGDSPCAADGEMLPMRRLTSSPYAMNAGAVGGKTIDQLLQLGQGVQNDTSNNSSVFINKTGSGNLIQLQNADSDVFTVTNSGDLTFGSASDHIISIAEATETDGDGADLTINAGAGNGTGSNGNLYLGASNTANIQIGDSSSASSQDIQIGTNNTAGSITDITIGSGSEAAGGSTNIQSKDNTSISTNGTTRAVFDTDGTLSLGNGVASDTPADFRIQGTASSATGISGSLLTVQGGDATVGDADGGNLHLSGGDGSGSGTKGLVVIDTPTYGGATTQSSAVDVSVMQTNVDSFGVISLRATASDLTFNLPTPSRAQAAAGRIIYVTPTDDSYDFQLKLNNGQASERTITVKAGSAANLLWSGSSWLVAGANAPSSLQQAYDNTIQGENGGSELVVGNNAQADGLTIRDSSTSPINNILLDVQDSEAENLFSVSSSDGQTSGDSLVSDGSVNDAANFSTNWSASETGDVTVTQDTNVGNSDSTSVRVDIQTGAEYAGVKNKLAVNPEIGKSYKVKLHGAADTSFEDFVVRYSPDGGTSFKDCTDYSTNSISSVNWSEVSCTINTGKTAASDPYLYLVEQSSQVRAFYLDDVSMSLQKSANSKVKVGNNNGNSPTLLTIDKGDQAPTADNDVDLLGSMYYDTSLGKVQCYQADGWGNCGDRPDTFVTLSPEYANSVMNGTDVGEIDSGLCSDSLDINDGSSGQPTVCGLDETYNFYDWTSNQVSEQTKSIFVTYKLPDNFTKFVDGSTYLSSRTDSADATVSYQIYRNQTGSGLVPCGDVVTASTGAQTVWNQAPALDDEDPYNCGFEAGDSLVIRINLIASNDAHAYASNLGFTYSSN